MTQQDMDLVSHVNQNRAVPRPNVEQVLGGVTASWLAQAFGMDVKDVKRKLAGCPALVEGQNTGRGYQGRLYELRVAAAYLVKPKISASNFLAAVKKAELPATLQQSFWDAMLKRQKYEENAGDLWRTAKIREVLGQTFQSMKFTIQLWVDTVERATGLTSEQRRILIEASDGLQGDLYATLVRQMENGTSGSQLTELPSMLDESAEEAETYDEDDGDGMELI
jgi:hypothetical protein